MCEVMVRVVDKTNSGDPYLCSKLTKRGDVIVVVDDGWSWGAEELINPDWLILKLPLVSKATAESLLGPEIDTDPANPSYVLQRRAFRLDVDALPINTAALTEAEFLQLKQRKASLDDPNILG